eukprot:TRINITY_DN17769_c2_g1_i1.p1 TRINITY_DN17769_c2_g1~~TRINITY_DN17769_c2_g1_i1.p1  ORF type:complete len:370 (+),score=37.31 TRINITY_DN17769_c2_g1_i1:38-1147(+)
MASASARLSTLANASRCAANRSLPERRGGPLTLSELHSLRDTAGGCRSCACPSFEGVHAPASRAPERFQEATFARTAVDFSNLPPTWMDPRGEAKEGTLTYDRPPSRASNGELITMYENRGLMLPSERYREHLAMKDCQKAWRQDRAAIFQHNKQMKALENRHANGIVGIDSPMYSDTELFARQRSQYKVQCDAKEQNAVDRLNSLSDHMRSDEALVGHVGCGAPPPSPALSVGGGGRARSMHNLQWQDTHSRVFSRPPEKEWDPERAAVIRSHDVRDRRHNFVNGADNSLVFRVRNALPERELRHAGSAPAGLSAPLAFSPACGQRPLFSPRDGTSASASVFDAGSSAPSLASSPRRPRRHNPRDAWG